jgi:gliding motility-associated-like protein
MIDFPSQSFNVETPFPIIHKIEDPVIEASKGATIERFITIKNTRPGRLESFLFTDTHTPGIVVNMPEHQVVSMDETQTQIILSANDFVDIGNGDIYFDFNEELIIRESIDVLSCAFDRVSARSSLSTSWGCDSTICQTYRRNAQIQIESSFDEGDLLQTEPLRREIACRQGDQNSRQHLRITHAGTNSVYQNASFTISQTTEGTGILNGSIQLNGIEGEILPSALSENECGIGLHRSFDIRINRIEPGQEFEITWMSGACILSCDQIQNSWTYQYAYEKECAPQNQRYVHSGRKQVGSPGQQAVTSNLSLRSQNSPIMRGESGEIELLFNHPLLTSSTGEISLHLTLPCELSITEDDFSIAGVDPSLAEVTTSNGPTTVILRYPLPLPANDISTLIDVALTCGSNCTSSDCFNDWVTSCEENCIGPVQEGTIRWEITINPEYICNPGEEISFCDETSFLYACATDPCEVFADGYLDYSLKLYRTDYGFPDNDNDHLVDPVGQIDTSKIALQHLIQGDTFVIDIKGRIIEDRDSQAQFNYGLLNLKAEIIRDAFGSLNAEASLDNMFNENQWIKRLSADLIIVDSNQQKRYRLQNIPYSYDPFENEIDYELSSLPLALGNSGFPGNFYYQKGDSVLLKLTFQLDRNFAHITNDYEMDIELTHKIFFDKKPINKGSTFHCGCKKVVFGIRGFGTYHNIPNNSDRTYCEEDFLILDIRRGLVLDHEKDDFPYEIRMPYKFAFLEVIKGDDLELTRLRYSDNQNPGSFELPLDRELIRMEDSLQLWDEFTEPRIVAFGKGDPCANPYLDEDLRLNWILIPQENPAYFDTIRYGLNGTNIQPATPSYNILTEDPYTESQTDTLEWIYSFAVHRQTSFNTWVYFEDDPNVEVLELFSNTHDVSINNESIYQLGEIPVSDTVELVLRALVNTCETIALTMRFGAHCDVVKSRIQPICYERTEVFEGRILEGKSEHFVQSSELTLPFCVDTGSLVSTIFNADRGHLKEVTTTLELPPGITFIPGTCEINYPSGSSQWVPIGDPVRVQGELWEWKWSNYLPELFTDGLNGSDEVPFNGFDLRFQFKTDCGYISGSKFIYRTIGTQFCNINSNNLAKVSGSIHIEGARSTFNSSISLNTFEEANCDENGFLDFRLSIAGNVGESDSLYISLPSFYEYIKNTAPIEPVRNGRILSWPLSSVDSLSSFELSFSADHPIPCGQDILSIYTAAGDSVWCEERQTVCPVSVINGRIDLPVSIDLPSVLLKHFSLSTTSTDSNLVFLIELENDGLSTLTDIVLDLYSDSDSIRGPTMGDFYIGSAFTSTSTLPGGGFTWEIPGVETDLKNLCNLMAVVSLDSNCHCASNYLYLERPLTFASDSVIRACPGDQITLGLAQEQGLSYQWTEFGLVSCDTCSITTYIAENNGQTEREITFNLVSEDNGGCIANYSFDVMIQPNPRILTDPKTICPGDTIFLLSTEGQTYNWTGLNILSEDANTIVAAPVESGFYKVEITDELGCLGSDSVFIRVLPEAIAQAGPDLTYCFGENEAWLRAEEFPGLQYQWLFANDELENDRSPITRITEEVSRPYVLEVFNGLCFDYDTVHVDYYKEFEVAGLPDSVDECVGTAVSIQLAGGTFYEWLPFFDGMCEDSTCADAVLEVPPDSFPILVIGRNERGCIDSAFSYLHSYIDTPYFEFDTTLCLFEEIDWRGYHISEPGTYCDTVPLEGFCAEVTCLNVFYIPMDTIRWTDTLCLGDSTNFFGRVIKEDGTFIYQPDSVSCDTLFELTVRYFEEAEGLEDSIFLTKDICENLLVGFPNIFETYQWTPEIGLTCYFCPNPLVITNDTSVYTLITTDINGCVEDYFVSIAYENCRNKNIYIPNAFSPNGDGINDRFQPYHGGAIEQIESILIFDRWGNRVYESYSENNSDAPGWDGTFKGKQLNPGTFIYRIAVRWKDGIREEFKGEFVLVD